MGVCVKTCPKKAGDKIECHKTSKIQDCNSAKVSESSYETIDIANYCFPKNVDDLPAASKQGWDNVVKDFKNSQAGKLINDMKVTKKAVFACMGLGFVYSILYIYAMSRFANCLAKFAILIIEFCLAGSAGVSFFLRSSVTITDESKNFYLGVGISMIIVFALFNLILFCFWKQVQVAIAVIDATADFFAATKRIIFTSVVYFFLTLVIILVWFAA
jgi:hypothetical protein